MPFYLIASDSMRLNATSETFPITLYCVASLPPSSPVPYRAAVFKCREAGSDIHHLTAGRVANEEMRGIWAAHLMAKNSSKHLCMHIPFLGFFGNKLTVHYLAIKTPSCGASGALGLNCRGGSHRGGVWPCFWWVTRRKLCVLAFGFVSALTSRGWCHSVCGGCCPRL